MRHHFRTPLGLRSHCNTPGIEDIFSFLCTAVVQYRERFRVECLIFWPGSNHCIMSGRVRLHSNFSTKKATFLFTFVLKSSLKVSTLQHVGRALLCRAVTFYFPARPFQSCSPALGKKKSQIPSNLSPKGDCTPKSFNSWEDFFMKG